MRHVDKLPASDVTRLIKFLLVALRFMTPGASPFHQFVVVVSVSRLLLSNPAAIDRKIAAAHSPKNTCPVKIKKSSTDCNYLTIYFVRLFPLPFVSSSSQFTWPWTDQYPSNNGNCQYITTDNTYPCRRKKTFCQSLWSDNLISSAISLVTSPIIWCDPLLSNSVGRFKRYKILLCNIRIMAR